MGVRIAGSEGGRQTEVASVEARSGLPETVDDVSTERPPDGASVDEPRRARHRRRRNARRRRVILAIVAVCAVAAFALWGRSTPTEGLVPAAVVALVGILLLVVVQMTISRRSSGASSPVVSREDGHAQDQDDVEHRESPPGGPVERDGVASASPLALEAGPPGMAPARPVGPDPEPARSHTEEAGVEVVGAASDQVPAQEGVPANSGVSQPTWMQPIVESSPEFPEEAFHVPVPQLMALRAVPSRGLDPLEDADVDADVDLDLHVDVNADVDVDVEAAVRGQSDELAEVGDLLVSLHRRFGVMYRSRIWVEEILPACALGTMEPELTRDLLAAAVLGAGGVEVDRDAFSLLHDEATVQSTISHLHMALIEFEARLSRGAMPVTLK